MIDEDDSSVTKLLFDDAEDERSEFDRIPEAERRHPQRDICAILYLNEKLGIPTYPRGETRPAIASAEHDIVYLSYENLDKLTRDDVMYLSRCGVFFDGDGDCLAKFV